MNSNITRELSEELKTIIIEYRQYRKNFIKNFRRLLEKQSFLNSNDHSAEFLSNYKKIRHIGVANKHYAHLLLILYIAYKNSIDLYKTEIDRLLKIVEHPFSTDIWKKITSNLKEDENNLIYKKRIGKELRLSLSSTRNILFNMFELIKEKEKVGFEYDFSIGICSKPHQWSEDLDYQVDFTSFFLEKTPSTYDWEKMRLIIREILEDISIKKKNSTVLITYPKINYSLALLLGNAFADFEDQNMLIRQYGKYWHIRKLEESIFPKNEWNITVNKTKGDPSDINEIFLSVGITEPIKNYAIRYWKKNNLRPNCFAHLSILPEPQFNSISTPIDETRKINALYSVLTRLKNSIAYIKINLFIFAPTHFLILLGRALSSVSKVQVYEFDQETGDFNPTAILNRY